MIPVDDVPAKADDEVWLRRASTVSRKRRRFHTQRNCPKLRKGGPEDADDILTVSDPDNSECRFCDESVTYPQDNVDQKSLAVKLQTGDDTQQVLKEHDWN
jgi:hypothetical protein